MKRTVILLLSFLLLMSFIQPAAHAASERPLLLYLDGKNLKPSTAPQIVNQTTMVPGRVISEALGAQVQWNRESRSVTIVHQQNVLILTDRQEVALANGKPVTLQQPPFISGGSLLLPLRFIAEQLGILVRWDKPTHSINLWTSNTQVSGSDPETDPEIPEIPGGEYPVLNSIQYVNNQLVVKTSGSVTPQVFTLTAPDRVVIDIAGLRFSPEVPEPAEGQMGELAGISASDPVVSQIRYSEFAPETSTIRIVAELKHEAKYQIVNSGDFNSLIVHLAAPDESIPQTGGSGVLIYSSHARESFLSLLPGVTNPNLAFHSTKNISLLGARMAQNLQAKGHQVVHAKDDYQSIYGSGYSQSKSYLYSAKTVNREIAKHPNIKYMFDLHRDSSGRSATTLTRNGTTYARLYFVIGLENPDWKKNDAFAKKIQSLVNAKYPGISRGIYYKDRRSGNGWYNQNLSNRSALIEIGGVGSTLTETNRTIDILSDAIHQLVQSGY